MKIEVGQVWSFNNQAELDWLIGKIEGLGVEYKRSKEYEFYRDYNDMNRRKENTCLLIRENRTDFCYREYFEDKGYTILEAADYMEENQMFKVGDRVKVLKGKGSARYTKGMIGEIEEVDEVLYLGSQMYSVKFKDGNVWRHEEEELESAAWQEVEREPKLGSRNDTLIVEQNTDTKELRLTTGCFTGTLDEFEAAVKRKPFGNKHRYDYEFYIERYKVKYPDYKKEVRYVVKLNDIIYLQENERDYMLTPEKEDASTYSNQEEACDLAEAFGGTIEEITLNK